MTNQEISTAIEEDFKAVSGSNLPSYSAYKRFMMNRLNNLGNTWIGIVALIFIVLSLAIPMSIVFAVVTAIIMVLVYAAGFKLACIYIQNKIIYVATLKSNISRDVLNSMYETMREMNRTYVPTLKELDDYHELYLSYHSDKDD